MRRSPGAYDFCGVAVASDRPLPDLRRRAAADAECSIATARHAPPAPPSAWLQQWRLPGGRLWLSIGRVPDGYLLRFRDQADFVVSRDGSRIVVHPDEGLPEETLRQTGDQLP